MSITKCVATDTWRRADTLACVAAFVLTAWYCASAPYNLYVYDEGYFLYEAKRVLDGEVFYRDFFNIVTPLGWYVIAAAYWVFGVSMETARTTMAVIHGLIAAGMVIASRMMGARLGLAVVVGLSEAAVCYMATERAAPHWFGTLFCMFAFLAMLQRPILTARRAFCVGLLVGGLMLSQQQRGMAMIWVPIAVLALDRWILASPRDRSLRAMLGGIVAYAAGVGAVVIPVMLTFVAVAGFDNVYVALVRYPLFNYREFHYTPWGAYNPIQDTYIGPIVKYLSMGIPVVAGGRLLWLYRSGPALPGVLRRLAVTLLTTIGAFLGVTYVPGYGYLVLVGPVWFMLIADLAEAGFRWLEERRAAAWAVSATVVVAFLVMFGVRLGLRRAELAAQWAYTAETDFGRMNFASAADIDVLDTVRRIVSEVPGKELFIYPTAPGYYLLSGTNNVTRFQVILPGYSDPVHMQEILDVLETRKLRYVLRNWMWMDNDKDPIWPYLLAHYEKVPLPFPPKQLRTVTLFRRKADSGPTSF